MPARQAHSRYKSTCLLLACLALLSGVSKAQAVGFGPLVGQGVLGQSLQVQAELSDLSELTLDQLRSTCMRASFRPNPSDTNGADAMRAVPMSVDFVSTSKGRGLVRLRSREIVTEPVGDLRLVSECPLAVFEVSWPVLLDPSTDANRNAVQTRQYQVKETQREFSFASSDALLGTFKYARGETPGSEVKKVQINAPVETKPAPVKQTASAVKQTAASQDLSGLDVATKPASVKADKPDELAMLDQRLLDVNLIPSGPSGNASNTDLNDVETKTGYAGLSQGHEMPVLLGSGLVIVTVLLAGFWYLRGRSRTGWVRGERTNEHLDEGTVDLVAVEPSLGGASSASPVNSDPGPLMKLPRDDASDMSNSLLMGSFLGADQAHIIPQDPLAGAQASSSMLAEGHQQSLNTVLALVNKAGARPWALPVNYQSLIEDRNRVLLMSTEGQARLLRSQIGLIELAFQEAKRGRSLERDVMAEFMEVMLNGYDLGSVGVEVAPVSDVIKSYTSAKFCEVSGAQAKALLKGNCMLLAALAERYPVCFSSPDWAQWVNESCVGV